jgi:hypothetical protein
VSPGASTEAIRNVSDTTGTASVSPAAVATRVDRGGTTSRAEHREAEPEHHPARSQHRDFGPRP